MASRFRPTPRIRERRKARLAPLVLRSGAGQLFEVVVRDVSSRGLSAFARGAIPLRGEPVEAVLPDGRVLWGLVRWVEGRSFGVEFSAGSG